jgi:hypothetical protein
MKVGKTFLFMVMLVSTFAVFTGIGYVTCYIQALQFFYGALSTIGTGLAAALFIDANSRLLELVRGERRMRELSGKQTSVPLWPDGKGGWTTEPPKTA